MTSSLSGFRDSLTTILCAPSFVYFLLYFLLYLLYLNRLRLKYSRTKKISSIGLTDYFNRLRLKATPTHRQPSDSKLDARTSHAGPATSILLLVNSLDARASRAGPATSILLLVNSFAIMPG